MLKEHIYWLKAENYEIRPRVVVLRLAWFWGWDGFFIDVQLAVVGDHIVHRTRNIWWELGPLDRVGGSFQYGNYDSRIRYRSLYR